MLAAEQSWAGAADAARVAPQRRPRHGDRRGRDDGVRRRGRPHRHDGVVQPLGGDGSAQPAAPAAIDPEAFNRFEAAGWEARAGSYGFLAADHRPGHRGAARRRSQAGAGRAAARRRAPGRATSRRRARRSGARTRWGSTSRRRWSGGRRSPTRRSRSGSARSRRCPAGAGAFDAVVGNFVFNHVGRPAHALGEARRVLRPGGLARALDLGRAEPQPACWASCSTRSSRPMRRPRPACPRDRPTSATTTSCGRCSRRAGFVEVGVSHLHFETARRRRGHPVARRARLRGAHPAARHRAAARRPGRGSGRRSTAGRGPPAGGRHARDPGRRPGDPGHAGRERAIRVAYTGEPGAFAEEAVLRFFAAPETVTSASFRAVFEAVRDGTVDAGVVPVESSLLGTIRENLDLLWSFDLPIAGEVSVPGPARAARPARGAAGDGRARLLDLRRARPGGRVPAVAPVDDPDHVQHRGRGEAGRGARASAGSAAVASARVAPIYGLEVLADDIQSGTDNRTRFAVIARRGRRGAGPGARRRPSPSPARRGRPSCSPSATSPAASTGRWARSRPAGSTCPGSSHARGRSAARAGSTCSGWTSTRTPREPACAAALAELAGETEIVRILGTFPKAAEE